MDEFFRILLSDQILSDAIAFLFTAIPVVLILELIQLIGSRGRRNKKNLSQVKELISKLLDLLCVDINRKYGISIRAIVFLPTSTKDQGSLKAFIFSSNVSIPDMAPSIRIEKFQGAVGSAWGYRAAVAVDRSLLDDKQLASWNLTHEQIFLTNNSNAVLAVPIYNQNTQQIMGVLSLDTDISASMLMENKKLLSDISVAANLIGLLVASANLPVSKQILIEEPEMSPLIALQTIPMRKEINKGDFVALLHELPALADQREIALITDTINRVG